MKSRVDRDQNAAEQAMNAASLKLKKGIVVHAVTDFTQGPMAATRGLLDGAQKQIDAWHAIVKSPFQAMVEVDVKAERNYSVVWYGNQRTNCNEVLDGPTGQIHVLSWTHPGFQVALTSDLDDESRVGGGAYTLKSVRPTARARFRRVTPQIRGLYEPGGEVRGDDVEEKRLPTAGLKAVKLEMTNDQVKAFVSKMHGFMMVSGAPGTGKTTIAFQRIRFLFDQQDLQADDEPHVRYEPQLTKVFLANKNLINHTKNLLVEHLQIPADVVEYVPTFITDYLDSVWQHKQNARLRTRKIPEQESRSREAIFNLCKASDLKEIWASYERQISSRLKKTADAEWTVLARDNGVTAASIGRLSKSLRISVEPSSNPLSSGLRMDELYRSSAGNYDGVREQLSEKLRRNFETSFSRWLFWVYDPIESVASYFSGQEAQATLRIRSGTAELIPVEQILERVRNDWADRMYGPEESAWLAWLLRFALPEEDRPENRFRDVPHGLPAVAHKTENRLTHVVIDEAQDLSVQEASLLCSLVAPKGSLTVSADFRQVVSPVHGTVNADALKVGLSIKDKRVQTQFTFSRNMRQSREIGAFLEEFYLKAFKEMAPFEPGSKKIGNKPALYLTKTPNFPKMIRQMMRSLGRSGQILTTAVLQVNDDPKALHELRLALESEKVGLAPEGIIQPGVGGLILTSVEKAKGLEFDVCVVIGLDDVERASLNFAKQRAYVALSRPTQRLFMLCEELPSLLAAIRKDLFELFAIE